MRAMRKAPGAKVVQKLWWVAGDVVQQRCASRVSIPKIARLVILANLCLVFTVNAHAVNHLASRSTASITPINLV